METDLTFITSFFRDSGHLIRNIKTVRDFNPNSQHKWILIDNSSGGTDFEVVKEEQITIYKGINEKFVQPLFMKKASDANAISINFGISKSDTRFICVMDPDFFVIHPNWIETVLDYMDAAGVGILSAPYHPIWYQKAHRATGHFMVIDTQFIPKARLDFAPGLKEFYASDRRLPKWIGDRRNVRKFYDCGSQVEELFKQEMEYLIPLMDAKIFSRADKMLDKVLPKKWRKFNNDYPVIVANLTGILSTAEGYYWRGHLFAIHLRRFGQIMSGKDVSKSDHEIGTVLNHIYAGYKNILGA